MVNKKPKGLGLGLEALLGPKVQESRAPDGDSEPRTLKLAQIHPGRYQPRTRMDEGALFELAESIKSQGVMQPVLVRPVAQGRYEIIAGERRVRAAKLAGLDEVPVLVKAVPDEAAAVMALIENIQREDLNPLEEAQGLQRLTQEFGLTHEQAAQAVGRSRSAASNLLRLLNLAEPVQHMLMAGEIDMGHARALLDARSGAPDHRGDADRCQETQRARSRSAGRAHRRRLRPDGRRKASARRKAEKTRDVLRLEEELSDLLTAQVDIRMSKRARQGQHGGRIGHHIRLARRTQRLIDKLRRRA